MAATVLAAAALALTAQASGPAAIDVSYSLGVVSDYRFRGVSLSDERPALQAGVQAALPNGAYFGVWGSTIDEYAEDGDEHGATVELDVTLGWAFQAAGFDLDVGLSAYTYPRAQGLTYVEAPLSISRSVGPSTVTLGGAYAPRQSALDEDNTYVFAAVSWEIRATELSLSAGYEEGAFAPGGKWDWGARAARRYGPVRAELGYVGADVDGSSALVAGLSLEY